VAVIRARKVRSGKDLLCTAHVEPAYAQRPRALGRVAGYAHVITVATFNPSVNEFNAEG
jgi:hypothetical protein